jgi:bisphosphoglycerate-dependent phosphoglycerate mutase
MFSDLCIDMAEPPLDQKVSLQELRKYGRYTPAQYTATLSKTPRTLRQIRNADASMDALLKTNESFLTVPYKQSNVIERMRIPRVEQEISLKEELQRHYGAPEKIEEYAAKQGKNAVNVIEEYYEGGPTVEGVGTGKKGYPVFAPIKTKMRRANRKSRRSRRANRKTRRSRRANRKSRRSN